MAEGCSGAEHAEVTSKGLPAPTPMRVWAFAWDGLLVAGYAVVVAGAFLIVSRLAPGSLEDLFGERWVSQVVGSGLLTLPTIVALGLADARGAGFGKRRMNLRVERSDGRPPGRIRSLLRTALKLLPWELAHTALWEFRFTPESATGIITLVACYALAAVYLVTVAVDRYHRAPYDLLLGTCVVQQ